MKRFIHLLLLALLFPNLPGQELQLSDPWLYVNARSNDPLYTTYTASMERSRMYADRGYKMVYDNPGRPLSYTTDQAGSMYTLWLVNDVAVFNTGEYDEKPVVTVSFPDMCISEYKPYNGLKVQETFLVYSSRIALVRQYITNTSDRSLKITCFPVLEIGNEEIDLQEYNSEHEAYVSCRFESRKRLISNMNEAYPVDFRECFTANYKPYSYGAYKGSNEEFYQTIKTDHYAEDKYNDTLNLKTRGRFDFLALQHKRVLEPGESIELRYLRGIETLDEDLAELEEEMGKLKDEPLQPYLAANESLYEGVPRLQFKRGDDKTIYISALNLARGCMLPPEGQTSFNYYAFSRMPLWGWGHGHQVLHESLSMLAYVYLDPESAQNSQRVYIEQQADDGLIAYRHGPRGRQDYPHQGEPTTSAPFFSWINWEVYQVSKDQKFLEEAYLSGCRYMEWLQKNRDDDRDGTFEWGPYGIIENVRDWYNVVFQVSAERYLDVDKEDISDELECLDLSLMIVKEMRSLEAMARELKLDRQADKWHQQAEKTAALINERMWDEKTGFYYNVNAKDHSWFFMDRDLRRQEIIGLLPLWAEVADANQAEKLIGHLSNPDKFWRKYGIPTVAADDVWYSPDVDYCCKWNGPVWLLWNYMIYDGLKNYHQDELAHELAQKMISAAENQLRKNHNFWESFSPDHETLNSPSNYIWDAILAKLYIEELTK
ncbi:MAG TPA: hypothetical protein ENF21_03975 [Bacteroidetes bacterium]|nr:hypothetical protein [Bacteroidota bacterium]